MITNEYFIQMNLLFCLDSVLKIKHKYLNCAGLYSKAELIHRLEMILQHL